MYSREIDGQEVTFGVSGKLIMNVLVMYDRQTGSLWSQLLGEAVRGELAGTRLEYFSSRMTTWEDWKARYPDTKALVKGYSGGYDQYDSYYASERAGVLGEEHQDDRLQTKQFVIGVSEGDEAVAYPFSVLSLEPALNDVVGGRPVLVVFQGATRTGVVFDRQIEGQTLTFSMVDPEQMTLIDEQTGSTWDGLAGVAIAGPLEGQGLGWVKSTTSFWFGWKDWYPDTRVYGQDT